MRKSLPQKEKVLNHLRKKGTITTFQAFTLYGITRLPARISELRRDFSIYSETVVKKSNGRTIHFSKYRWGKKEAA